MGNAPIAPSERHNLASIPEVSSSHDDLVSEMTRTNSVNAKANELESTQVADETTRYLPKGINRSSNAGLIIPSKPYGPPYTAGGSESPQWGWYINITSPATEMYQSGSSRPLPHHHKKQQSSAYTSQSSTRYLPKGMNRFSNGVIMPSKPYGCGGASTACDIESPQWDFSISVTPPVTDLHHYGSRYLPKKQDSSANASQTSSGTEAFESLTATNCQPNRIFQDMQKGALMGWSSVPL
jgi:hypothetical protein